MEPKAFCNHCGRIRGLERHMRNEKIGPARAAKQWLKKTCQHKSARPSPCDVRYQAGVDVAGIREALIKRKSIKEE